MEKRKLTSEELYFSALTDNIRIAETFRNAILYAYPNLKNLEVDYDGKNLTFNFDGGIDEKGAVLLLVNELVLKTTEKRSSEIDVDRILKNTDIMMRSEYGDDYIKKMGKNPFLKLRKETK